MGKASSGNNLCGFHNCGDFHSGNWRLNYRSCCYNPASYTTEVSYKIDWKCFCSSSTPCTLGQGRCRRHSDCLPGYQCGYRNCQKFHSRARWWVNCCEKEPMREGVEKLLTDDVKKPQTASVEKPKSDAAARPMMSDAIM